MEGWIKLHRKLSEKAYYKKDPEMVLLWIHLLFRANRKPREEYLGGKMIMCQPGQFTTGRKQLSEETGISESKIERLLIKMEKIEQQIEQRKTNTNRLISILNWSEYQAPEQQIEQQPNNDRTTIEQRPDTLQEYKEDKTVKTIPLPIKTDVQIHKEGAGKIIAAGAAPPIDERKTIFYKKIAEFSDRHSKGTLRAFFDYWSEHNENGKKMRFEMERVFDISRRLSTWERKEKEYGTDKQKGLTAVVERGKQFGKL